MRVLQFLMIFSCISSIASQHNHNQIHNQQLFRMYRLGLLFDIEKEKELTGLASEKLRHRLGLPSVFDIRTVQARQDLPADFKGILNAMQRLLNSMVCCRCQITYRAIIDKNIQELQNIKNLRIHKLVK